MTSRFRALLLEGLKRFAESGPPSDFELTDWMTRLHAALDLEVPSDLESQKLLRDVLGSIYERQVVKGGIKRRVPEVLKYTIDQVAPQLRAELDRRIYAAADLIKIRKAERKAQTLARFAGWLSSVPIGGSAETDLRAVASEIAKPVARVKFESRRVAIDQGHKLNAAVAHVVAQGSGAIGATWHSRGEHDHTYDARPVHLARAEKFYLVKDSWAMNEGLVKRGGPYIEDLADPPSILPFCSCTFEYASSPGNIPEEHLTAKGKLWVKGAA